MKAKDMRTALQFMRLLPDEAIEIIDQTRLTMPPRDNLDKTLLALLAGEADWRRECRS